MTHPHPVLSFQPLSGSPTGQTLHPGHYSSVFQDCQNEPSFDLNFVQKLTQNSQKPHNEHELGFHSLHNENNSSSQLAVVAKVVSEAGISNGVQDKSIAEVAPVKAAPRSRCHWSHGEVMALFDAKKAEADRFDVEMPGKKIKYSAERWDEVAAFVKARGCTKQASQCKDKWEKIWPAFRKIFDWEKQIPPGKSSFWTMPGDEREREGFPRGFDKELYDVMAARFGYIRPIDLASIVVDSSNEETVDVVNLGNDATLNETEAFDDSPSVVDDLALVSFSQKRKTSGSSSKMQTDYDIDVKKVNDPTNRTNKDSQLTKKLAELAERKLALEERKMKLAERRFLLEEKKLEATIEIGRGLITSMEKMTHTIASLGAHGR
ncbi:hypothetical protein KP509_14G033200 [Ceratopteris richardii]|uniref:Myb-like domain-containing protein n=1 Tax=Ceratopteris richardii TaxID=49495 RepID=A0A8T2TBZ3_CERRI|nr:hypothetical protein KP509_14G033200 [Ceratopteris richardii]KAH7415222.1 hypothetical protein KP509_14G033200 [Ceratopteris richardii]KAH7415223.1 hypothetical protein KP509_14G033200 [Ceratopteris richardii]KAH7415224.1 hypothetical protein KP509_14G033200 [Ceratopteris richardii]